MSKHNYSIDRDIPQFFIRKPKVPYSYRYKEDKENQNVIRHRGVKSQCEVLKEITYKLKRYDANHIIAQRSKTQHISQQIEEHQGDEGEGQIESGTSQQVQQVQNIVLQRRFALVPIQKPINLSDLRIEPHSQNCNRLQLSRINFEEHAHIQYSIKNAESKDLQIIHYFEQIENHISERDYQSLVQFLHQCVNIYQKTMTNETYFLALSIFDRFIVKNRYHIKYIYSSKKPRDFYQFAIVISLFLASKTVDVYCLTMQEVLINILHELYSIHSALQLEQTIIQALNYDVHSETIFTIFDQLFFYVHHEMGELQFQQLDHLYSVGVMLLKNIHFNFSFRSYSLQEVALGCLISSFLINLENINAYELSFRDSCIQRVFEISSSINGLNINTLEQLVEQITKLI